MKWLRSPEDLPALLASLDLPEDVSIPVHALVDSTEHLRCASIRTILGDR